MSDKKTAFGEIALDTYMSSVYELTRKKRPLVVECEMTGISRPLVALCS